MKAFQLRGVKDGFEYGVLLAKSLDGLVVMLGAKETKRRTYRLPKKTFWRLGIGEAQKQHQDYYLNEITLLSF